MKRILAGAATALLPLTLLATTVSPADAGSLKRHGLQLYKIEKFVTLDGEYPDNTLTTTLRCEAGAVAVDGSWLIDDYETPNADEGVAGDERSVVVTASYGGENAADGYRDWTFSLENPDTGRAQVKLFVTCLEISTGNQHGHSHSLQFEDRSVVGGVAVTAGAAVTGGPDCGTGEIVTAPGFRFTADASDLTRSRPDTNLKWQWRFSDAGTADFYVRCLSLKTDQAGGGNHVHKLDFDWTPFTPVVLDVSDRQIRTVDAYKRDYAAVGGFTIHDPSQVTYLGSGHRGRERDFTFWNTTAGQQVEVGVLSLARRTSQQLKP